jgi:hypothetical protein
MVYNKVLGRTLTAKEMKRITGGEKPKRKTICVICGPGDVHCASVPSYYVCYANDNSTGTGDPGDMACSNPYDSQEDMAFSHNCAQS